MTYRGWAAAVRPYLPQWSLVQMNFTHSYIDLWLSVHKQLLGYSSLTARAPKGVRLWQSIGMGTRRPWTAGCGIYRRVRTFWVQLSSVHGKISQSLRLQWGWNRDWGATDRTQRTAWEMTQQSACWPVMRTCKRDRHGATLEISVLGRRRHVDLRGSLSKSLKQNWDLV